jgi:hypothetical protein
VKKENRQKRARHLAGLVSAERRLFEVFTETNFLKR